MATTKTTIVNQALYLLGEDRINSIDDATGVAPDAKEIYDDVRDEVIRGGIWRFARRRAKIAADPTPPDFGYGARYALPADPFCLRVVGPSIDIHGEVPWETEGRFILTDIPSPLHLFFLGRVTNESEFDAGFVSCFAARLAHGLAFKITDRESLSDKMWDLYLRRLPVSLHTSSSEGKKDRRILSGSFIDARFMGTNQAGGA